MVLRIERGTLEKGYEFIIEMDADFSHSTEDLVKIHKFKNRNKLIIGSRYIPKGQIVDGVLEEEVVKICK